MSEDGTVIKLDEKMARYLEKSLLGGLSWPTDAEGLPEPAMLLEDYPDRTVFENVMMSLRMYGIPAFEQFGHEIPFTKVLFGSSLRGAKIYVPQSLREDAVFLLTTPPDPSEVDV